ncbi:hypothetical protein [Herbiconiux daphne]|uniref:Glycosyltransferase RgtA/B/C/D-like domain-containing protein n=1 Tax=Herbiconiux daphne TaxID=2970914 RepID=A0ABT2H4N2_9MICO|nr:hypothetical protein [Herbiconiux daphne]MCS5734895.1 hypothetical protein [Herbiconiux daphne]
MSMWLVLVWLGVLAIPLGLVFLGAMTATRSLWQHTPQLAPLLATVGLALAAWLTFVAYWVAPAAGLVAASVLLGGAIVAVAHGGVWRRWREAVPVLALMAGAITFAIAFSYLWGAATDPYSVVAGRFFHFLLPSDNTIPMLFADKLALGQSTTLLLGDWNGGDRPPLQTGFELLVSPVVAVAQAISGLTPVGLGGTLPLGASFAVDVLSQFLWLPVGYSLLRLLRFRAWVAIGALVFATVVPTILVDSVYTWPKMLSAALVLAALGFLLATRQTTTGALWPFVFAVISATFAVLAHGAAAFAIPALVIVGLVSLRGRGIRASFSPIALGAVAGILLYAPWFIYQRFTDPPGDRLLKWHLAGWVPVTQDSFADVLVAQYSALPFRDLVGNRLANLGTVFGADQFYRLADPNVNPFVFLRVVDWTSTAFALGVIAVGCLVAMIAWNLARRRRLDSAGRQRLLIVGAMLVCIVVWVIALFSANAAIVAQGSHAWILVLATVPFAWLLERVPRLALPLVGVQAVGLMVVYFALLRPDAPQRFSPAALVVGAAALAFTLVVPMLLARRSGVRHGAA